MESARAATIVSGTGYANSSFLGDLVQEVVISAVSFTSITVTEPNGRRRERDR